MGNFEKLAEYESEGIAYIVYMMCLSSERSDWICEKTVIHPLELHRLPGFDDY